MGVRAWFLVDDARTRLRRALLGVAGGCALLAFVLYYTHLAFTWYFDPARGNAPDGVVVLTTSWCPYCHALRTALSASHLPFSEVDVEQDWKTGYAFYATRQRGVPVTVIGRSVIPGGLSAQLDALRALCERRNQMNRYDCRALHPSDDRSGPSAATPETDPRIHDAARGPVTAGDP